jgi:hypothetical protein
VLVIIRVCTNNDSFFVFLDEERINGLVCSWRSMCGLRFAEEKTEDIYRWVHVTGYLVKHVFCYFVLA